MRWEWFAILSLALLVCHSAASPSTEDVLFQVSTLEALKEGIFDGTTGIGALLEHGDFGLGTFNRLDGEMVVLDGVVYQAVGDGSIHVANNSAKTPFADVTYFQPDIRLSLEGSNNLTELEKRLEGQLPSKNLFYALRIDGSFDQMTTRSVSAQTMPYPTLEEALKDQTVSRLGPVEGTVVGFISPDYFRGLTATGYHFHFVDANRSRGGHVLDLQVTNATVLVDQTSEFDLLLPEEGKFLQADLAI
jgi:acetolactate decarboxylase